MYKDSTKRYMEASRRNALLPSISKYGRLKKETDEFLRTTPNPKGNKRKKKQELRAKHKQEHINRLNKDRYIT